jgi:hypothetical protein
MYEAPQPLTTELALASPSAMTKNMEIDAGGDANFSVCNDWLYTNHMGH